MVLPGPILISKVFMELQHAAETTVQRFGRNMAGPATSLTSSTGRMDEPRSQNSSTSGTILQMWILRQNKWNEQENGCP